MDQFDPYPDPTRGREALNLRGIVSRLLQWLRGIQRKPRPPVASPLQPFQPTLSRQWPVGPPYMTLTIRDKNPSKGVLSHQSASKTCRSSRWPTMCSASDIGRITPPLSAVTRGHAALASSAV